MSYIFNYVQPFDCCFIHSYGDEGAAIISLTLKSMFPEDTFTLADHENQPLPYNSFVKEVLLCQAAVLLIQNDLGIDYNKAVKTLANSGRLGSFLHPGDDSPALDSLIEQLSKRELVPIKNEEQDDHPQGETSQGVWDSEDYPTIIEDGCEKILIN